MSDVPPEVENIGPDRSRGDQPKGMNPAKAASYWQHQIALAIREHQPYWAEVANVERTYRNAKTSKDGGKGSHARMNIMFANVETLRGAIYARSGKPDIRPRWLSNDQAVRTAAEVLERQMLISIDTRDHEEVYEQATLRALLAGRAVIKVDAVHQFDDCEHDELPTGSSGPTGLPPLGGLMPPMPHPEMGGLQHPVGPLDPVGAQSPLMGDNGGPPLEPEPPEVCSQVITKTLIETEDFIHSPARNWGEVWWIAFRLRMTRDDMHDNGFKEAAKVPLTCKPMGRDGKADEAASDDVSRAEVWEVWSKVHKQRIYIVKDHGRALKIDDDPLSLEGFWPIAQPIQFLKPTGGTIVPALDWWQYRELATDLERLNKTVADLAAELKFRGVYDSSVPELAKLAKAPNRTFLPIQNFGGFADKGGLQAGFQVHDIRALAETMLQAMEAAATCEGKIDKLTGISDIMRGDGEKGVTATEQQIKAQYGGIRIKGRQRAVQQTIRDTMRIEAELIAELFEPHILAANTGMEVGPDVMAVLRNDKARACKIDIETDSTVYEDSEAAKAATAEAVQTAVGLMKEAVGIMQGAPELGEVIFELLSLQLKSLKGGRAVDDVIDRARQAMQQRIQQQQQAAQQPPPPDPRQEAEQARTQAMMQKSQIDTQKAQMDLASAQTKHAMSMEHMHADHAVRTDQRQQELAAALAAYEPNGQMN